MTSFDPRISNQDNLINPQNAAVVIIDYQPTQVNSINSMNRADLIARIVLLAELAINYKLPVVLSTVNVATGANKDTIPPLKQLLKNLPTYDRTSINAWEDREFNQAVKATGRQKLIMAALWTEACLTFPTLDAIEEGFKVYPVVDAVGGTSLLAHETALRRVEQAGARLTSLAQLNCELQRDWNRRETVPGFVKIMQEAGVFLKLT